MKHINLQGKISKYLIENGPKDTKEIQQFCATLSNKKSGSKSNLMFNQPINVISNIMRRKYLLYGMAGTGKTGAAVALANGILGDDAKSNFFEINASDDRRLETVRTKVKSIAQNSSYGDVPFRIVLLDEMGGMTTDAQNALKRLMERYASNIRFSEYIYSQCRRNTRSFRDKAVYICL